MMCNRFNLLVLFLGLAAGSQAILPPDAAVREPEIRAQRIEMERQYQERIQKRRDDATEAYKRATAAIEVPPWELDRALNGKKSGGDSRPNAPQQSIEQKSPKQRILVSIVLLILIGSAVGWIRFKTRDIEQ